MLIGSAIRCAESLGLSEKLNLRIFPVSDPKHWVRDPNINEEGLSRQV